MSGKTCFDCVMNDDKLNNWNDIFLILSKTHTRTIINKNTFWLEKDYKSYSIDIVLLNPLHCALSLVINSAIPCFWEAFIVLPSIWPGRACSVCYPCLLSTFPHYIYQYIYLSWKKQFKVFLSNFILQRYTMVRGNQQCNNFLTLKFPMTLTSPPFLCPEKLQIHVHYQILTQILYNYM